MIIDLFIRSMLLLTNALSLFRYKKCIDVGMKTNWVLTEEERQRRFRKVREKQEMGGGGGSGSESGAAAVSNGYEELEEQPLSNGDEHDTSAAAVDTAAAASDIFQSTNQSVLKMEATDSGRDDELDGQNIYGTEVRIFTHSNFKCMQGLEEEKGGVMKNFSRNFCDEWPF